MKSTKTTKTTKTTARKANPGQTTAQNLFVNFAERAQKIAAARERNAAAGTSVRAQRAWAKFNREFLADVAGL